MQKDKAREKGMEMDEEKKKYRDNLKGRGSRLVSFFWVDFQK